MTDSISIFDFLEYRKFLDAAIPSYLAQHNSSWRALATEIKLTSPNYLQQTIQGKRRLHVTNAHLLSQLFKQSPLEWRYFERLIAFDEARGHQLKDELFRDLLILRNQAKARPLEANQYAFFSQWWIPIVWELACHPHCQGSSEWIAKHIRPSITVKQTDKAIQILLDLDLLSQDDQGIYHRSQTTLHTTDEVRSIGALNYHKHALELATEALENTASEDRDFRCITLGVGPKTQEEIKLRMTRFWNEILALAQSSEEEVTQTTNFQFQFYPTSQKL